MPNMSYCRFENTTTDVEDCLQALYRNEHNQEDFSDHEKRALKRFVRACKDVTENFEEEILGV